MTRNRLLLCLIILCPLVSSCVYDREMAYFNDQIVSLNRKVTALQEGAGTKLETMQSNQARMRLEIDQLKTQVSELSGRTEDNEHIVKRIVEQDLSEQDVMKARIEEMTRRLEILDRLVLQQQQYLGLEPPEELQLAQPEEPAGPAAGPAAGTPPAADRAAPAQGPASADEAMPSDETELYDYALKTYRGGKIEAAREAFQAFLKRYPKSDRADNAHFWIGESYMAAKEYEQAILAYQNVIKKYPKGNKVANAMLRQAAAFLEIKDKTSARLLLKKIIKEHPGSSEAELAKKKLDSL